MKRILAAGLVLALPLLSACSLIPAEEVIPQMPTVQQIQDPVYETAQVSRGDLALEKIFSCSYQPAEEEKLYFAENGQAIEAIYVKPGDHVEMGQLIAELNNTAILQKIDNQQHTLDSLNLQIVQQLNYIENQKARIATLTQLAEKDTSYGSRLTSAKQTLESRNSQLNMLYAQLSVEKAVLEELEQDLANRQLYAGINGTVSYTLDLGNSTVYTRNHLICTIQNLGEAAYVGFFKEGLISEGQKIILRDTKGVEREVIAQSIAAPDANGNCSVTFSLVVPDTTLKAGDSARITMVTELLADTLYLPSKAIHTRADGAFVYYQDEAGLIAAKEVVTGPTINGCTQIVSGLKEGETILVDLP